MMETTVPRKAPLPRIRAGSMLLLLLGATWALAAAASDDEVEIGRRIYLEGMLPSGAQLQGERAGGMPVSGADAACVNCHRRSGMGSVEGDIQVLPVTGNYLFGFDGKAVVTMDPRSGRAFNQKHALYTVESLAEAVRHGMNTSGRQMSAAMAHYALSDAEMKGVIAYLRQLSEHWSPGVTADSIRFATVVTPDVEPERRRALLDTLRAAFAQKNGSTFPGRRYMAPPAEMMMGTGRKWELDVWELQGPGETWAGQLEERYRSRPVFALVSGASNGTWAPVHDFCQKERVPCWFPSVDLPESGDGFYALYFSRGVALEAEVLARQLRSATRTRKLVQVFRDDYVGRGAAQALSHALAGSGIAIEQRILGNDSPDGLGRALAGLGHKDAVMLWLRPADLAALNALAPPRAPTFFSAELARDDGNAIPAAWKGQARLVSPYEVPDKRAANLRYFRTWLKTRGLPLVDERLQAEAYFALDFLTDTVSGMLDNLYRDYLLERAEDMIARREGGKAEEEVRLLAALKYNPAPSTRREGTSLYPRLSLAPGQRFASKGGYLMRFDSGKLVAASAWVVP